MENSNLEKKELTIGEAAEYIVKTLKETSWKKSYVLLNGEVGMGKTTTISYILEELGIRHDQSPTYVTIKKYTGQNNKFRSIYHIDFYQTNNKKMDQKNQLIQEGLDNDGLYLVEWPTRFAIKEALRNGNLIIWVEFFAYFRCNINILLDRFKASSQQIAFTSYGREKFYKRPTYKSSNKRKPWANQSKNNYKKGSYKHKKSNYKLKTSNESKNDPNKSKPLAKNRHFKNTRTHFKQNVSHKHFSKNQYGSKSQSHNNKINIKNSSNNKKS